MVFVKKKNKEKYVDVIDRKNKKRKSSASNFSPARRIALTLSLVCLFGLVPLAGRLVVRAASVINAANTMSTSGIASVAKHDFGAQESPIIALEIGQRPVTNMFGLGIVKRQVTGVDLTDPDGKTTKLDYQNVTAQASRSTVANVAIQPKSFTRPGKYTVSFTILEGNRSETVTQDFTWGVLAINLRRSIERPNTPTEIGLAVLSVTGQTNCDADMTLNVTDPSGRTQILKSTDGTIIKNPDCLDRSVTNNFDYRAPYTTGPAGTYQLHLTADSGNGTATIDDSFEVRDQVDFDIARTDFSMRVYPYANYAQKFTINPRVAYRGAVTETVPNSFGISAISDGGTSLIRGDQQIITWNVDWQADETHTLGYTIDFPNVSPEFYLLGPLTINDPSVSGDVFFQEARRWQVAADAAIATGGSGDWNSTTNNAPWAGGVVPVAGDTVTIGSGHMVTIPAGYAAAATSVTLTTNNSANVNGVTFAASDSSLAITGNIVIPAATATNGSLFAVDAGTITTTSGTSNLAIGGNAAALTSIFRLSTGSVTLTGGITFSGTAANAQLTSTGAATITNTGTISGAGTITLTANTLTRFKGTSAVNNAYTTWKNWEIVDGTTTLGAIQTVTGLQVDAGATLAGATYQLTDACSGSDTSGFRIDGTFSGGTGGVALNTASCVIDGRTSGGGAATIAFTTTGTITVTNNVSIASTANLTITNTTSMAIVGAFTVTNSGTVTTTGASGITGSAAGSTWTQAAVATAILHFGGGGTTLLSGATLNASNTDNTVDYSLNGVQTCKLTNYYNLKFSGGNTKTCIIAVGTNSIQNIEMAAGTWTMTTAITALGNLTVSGGTLITGAVAFTVTGTTSITAGELRNTNSTGTKLYTNTVTLNGTGSLTGASTAQSYQGGITNTAGTVTITGTANFNTNTQTLTGTMAIFNITSGTSAVPVHNNGTITMGGTLFVCTGQWVQDLNSTLTFTGNVGFTNCTGTGATSLDAHSYANTIKFNRGGNNTCLVTQYWHIGFGVSGVKTCAPTSPTLGDVTISGTATWTRVNDQTINGALNITSTSGTSSQGAYSTTVNSLSMTGGGNLTLSTSAAKTFTVNTTTFITSGTLTSGVATGLKTFTGLVTVNGGTFTGASATIVLGAGLTITSGAVTLTGTVTMGTASGALTADIGMAIANISVTALSQTFSGAGTITVSGAVTANAGAGTAITNSGTVSAVTTTVTTGTIQNNGTWTATTALGGAGAFVNGNDLTGTLNINFTGTPGITTLTASAVANTVNYGFAGTQTCKLTNYYNLKFSGSGAKTCAIAVGTNSIQNIEMAAGTWTMTTAITALGTLTVDGGTITTGAAAFTVTGTTTISSGELSLTDNTGAKLLTGLVTLDGGTLSGGSTNIQLSAGITNNSGTVSITGLATVTNASCALSGATTISISTLTVNSPGNCTNTGTVTIDTALSGTGTFTNGANGTLNIGLASAITTLTPAAAANTINYTGTAQTVHAAATNNYWHLGFSGTGVNTIALPVSVTAISGNLTLSGTANVATSAALSIAGILTIGSTATFDITDDTLTLTGSGSPLVITSGGTFTTTGSTVSYENTTSATAASTTYNNLQFNPASGTPTYTLGTAGTGGWYSASWSYRVKVTVLASKVDADLTDYPVYVNLANLPADFHTHVNQTDARDIRVTTSNGTTEVPREVVSYVAASDTGELHFKAPGTLSGTSDTDFYIYYGNGAASDYAVGDTYGANNVWDSYTTGVWHMKEAAAVDSTSTNNTGSVTGDVAPTASGQMGSANDFPGTDDYITLATKTGYNSIQTAGFWFYSDGGTEEGIMDRYTGDSNRWDIAGAYPGTNSPSLGVNGAALYAADSDWNSTATWKHAVVRWDGSATRMFIDGSIQTGTSASSFFSSASGSSIHIGTYFYGGVADSEFNGRLDEVRLSTTNRSNEWISTEFNNQKSPSTFYQVGTETAQWYNTDWSYRKQHTINSATGAGTNYQVGIKVYYGSGTDGTETVDTISMGKVYCDSRCKTDFGDIRFTKGDGASLLDYWMESKTDSNNAIFWVEMTDSLESTNQVIKMYYGNSGVSTTSNATNTFLWYDDFNRASLGSDYTVESGTWSIDSSLYLQQTGTGGSYYSMFVTSLTSLTNYEMRYLWKAETGSAPDSGGIVRATTTQVGLYAERQAAGIYLWREPGNIAVTNAPLSGPSTTWHTHRIQVWSTDRYRFYEDGANIIDYTGSLTLTAGAPGMATYSATAPHRFDDMIVRKFISPEPAHGSWVGEETAPAGGGTGNIIVNGTFTTTGAGNEVVNAGTNDPVVTVTGNFTVGSGDTFQASDISNLTVGGAWTNGGTFTHNGGTVILTGTANIDGTANTTFNNLTVNGTITVTNSDNPIISAALNVADTKKLTINTSKTVKSNGTITLNTSGTIDGAGTLIITDTSSGPGSTGTLSSAVQYNATAGDIANTTFDARTYGGAVELYANAAAGKSVSTVGSGTYVFSSTLTLTTAGAGALTLDMNTTDPTTFTVSGALSIGASSILSATSGGTFNINSNYTNSGTFTDNSGTVTLNGSAQQTLSGTMTGSSDFNNLIITNASVANPDVIFSAAATTAGTFTAATAGTQIQFLAGADFTFQNIVFNGQGTGTRVTLTSSTTSAWNIIVAGTRSVLNTSVAYSTASASYANIDATDASNYDGGNTTRWDFAPPGITVAGTSNSSGGTVRVAVENFEQAQFATLAANWTISGVTVNSGDIVTVYVEGLDGVETTGVTQYDGTGNIEGMILDTNVLTIGSDDNQTIDLTDLVWWDCSDNENVMHSSSGGVLDIQGCSNSYSDETVTVTASDTLSIGNSQTMNAHNVTINTSGVLTSGTSGVFGVSGSWDNNGTFTPSTSTVTFNSGGVGETIEAGSSSFNHVVFNHANGGWTIQTNSMTTNDLTLTAGLVFTVASGITLEVQGNYSQSIAAANTTWTGATLYLNGSGGMYEINTKSHGGDTYATLRIGASEDIAMWDASATAYTIDSGACLYSQDHAGTPGRLDIYGTCNSRVNEYWSYAKDFDGAAVTRQADVRLASGASMTVDNGDSLEIIGQSAGANRTAITRQSSGNFSLTVSGTINAQYYDFDYLNDNGLNITSTATVTELSDGTFDNNAAGATSSYITVTGATSTKNLFRNVFDDNADGVDADVDYNVNADGGNIRWTFFDWSGNKAGESYDNEANGAIVSWQSDLSFSVSNNALNLGVVNPLVVKSASHTLSVTTNAANGYTCRAVEDHNLQNGTDDIDDVADSAVSAGSEEYGISCTGTECPLIGDKALSGSPLTVSLYGGRITASVTTLYYKAAISSVTKSLAYSHEVSITCAGDF